MPEYTNPADYYLKNFAISNDPTPKELEILNNVVTSYSNFMETEVSNQNKKLSLPELKKADLSNFDDSSSL